MSSSPASIAALLAISSLLPGCAPPPGRTPSRATGAASPTEARRSPAHLGATAVPCEGTHEESLDPKSIEVIAPERRVPEFHIATVGCSELHSTDLIGPKPVVILFFSSWCGVCEKKFPIVKRALDQIGDDATTFAVALDDDDTWADAEPFLKRHGIEVPLVRGDRFQRFSLGYNPFRSIPVIVVVGRDGLIIDLQLGYSPFDENRLLGAVEVGKRRAPAAASSSGPADPPETTPRPNGT
jgi:thiol-disulfide isomerase/thioredoxin